MMRFTLESPYKCPIVVTRVPILTKLGLCENLVRTAISYGSSQSVQLKLPLFGYPIATYAHQIQFLMKLPSFWPQFQVDVTRLRIHGQRPLAGDVDSAKRDWNSRVLVITDQCWPPRV